LDVLPIDQGQVENQRSGISQQSCAFIIELEQNYHMHDRKSAMADKRNNDYSAIW
jgi:hypothetical protein